MATLPTASNKSNFVDRNPREFNLFILRFIPGTFPVQAGRRSTREAITKLKIYRGDGTNCPSLPLLFLSFSLSLSLSFMSGRSEAIVSASSKWHEHVTVISISFRKVRPDFEKVFSIASCRPAARCVSFLANSRG